MADSRIPILTYHSIDESGSVISVSPDKFKRQMEFLKRGGFQTISLKEITECIYNGRDFPKKSIAITFDDGFKNIYSKAFPVLKEFGFTATLFLISGKCGKDNQWDRQTKNIPRLVLLSWDEILEMSDNGIEFGAHTMSHADLSKLSLDKAAEEITRSKSMIQGRLKKDTLFFAYPYGRQSEQIQSIVKDEFSGACSDKMGFTTLKSDIYSLPRIEMYYFSGNNLLSWIETPFFSYYIQWRYVLRSIRESMRSRLIK